MMLEENGTMDVVQVQELERTLESKILSVIVNFESLTGCCVSAYVTPDVEAALKKLAENCES